LSLRAKRGNPIKLNKLNVLNKCSKLSEPLSTSTNRSDSTNSLAVIWGICAIGTAIQLLKYTGFVLEKTIAFSGVGRPFFVRKALTSGTLKPEVRRIRFVGLPFAFTSGGGRRTDTVKPETIRSVKITVFSGIQ
jgi:hypothetical protein